MTTWSDLQDAFNDMIRELTESGRLAKPKHQSEDSDQDSTPTPGEITAEPKTTPDGIPIGVMLLPGQPRRKKSKRLA